MKTLQGAQPNWSSFVTVHLFILKIGSCESVDDKTFTSLRYIIIEPVYIAEPEGRRARALEPFVASSPPPHTTVDVSSSVAAPRDHRARNIAPKHRNQWPKFVSHAIPCLSRWQLHRSPPAGPCSNLMSSGKSSFPRAPSLPHVVHFLRSCPVDHSPALLPALLFILSCLVFGSVGFSRSDAVSVTSAHAAQRGGPRRMGHCAHATAI